MEEEKTGKRMKRKATPSNSRRWPNATVPYEIADNTFGELKISLVLYGGMQNTKISCLSNI